MAALTAAEIVSIIAYIKSDSGYYRLAPSRKDREVDQFCQGVEAACDALWDLEASD